ncbi:probable 39S ribosomal protein L24, mitochondrial isoform X2 [Hyalella azteca]|uniref:Large ribosomal subunit protein uL24m n=1 Tax=Hyalella azteca TaxID=294128 RepID=A0A8B7NZB3_HYAAZ|nr:probable 39S ribosomal protein L24, mitochondrial isoform X1 [Hyalella azteca]XP_018019170.1 probable 39S ribosomal protein L24, mitochondrial isoform X2 [Hyalella azteca]
MRLTCVMRCVPQVSKSTKKYSNLPESYIERAMDQIEWQNPDHGPQYVKGKVIKRHRFYFGEHRPWTYEFFKDNAPGSYKAEVLVEPIKDWSFFKGDLVEVLIGKDKGKQGLINYIVEERNWVFVEGLNCKFEVKGKLKDYPGMLVKVEKPLLVTRDVALVDPSDKKPTKIEWRYTEQGERVRVSLRSERVIPIPIMDEETVDYKTKSVYKEQPKDTVEADLAMVTFTPAHGTFQMQIMEAMGIQEHRVPKKSYWYYLEERC